MGIGLILGAAAAGHARGKFQRQQLDREEMLQAFEMEAKKRAEARANRQLDLEDKRLTDAERDRRDNLRFRMEDAAERGKDRDADREERRESHRQQSLDRADARSARREARELRPDEREKAADDFALRMVSATAASDPAFFEKHPELLPRYAQDAGARDMASAKKFGLTRAHYYRAAQAHKDRFTAKSKATATDAELEGGAPATPTAPASSPTLSDADRAKAASDPKFAAYLRKRGVKF